MDIMHSVTRKDKVERSIRSLTDGQRVLGLGDQRIAAMGTSPLASSLSIPRFAGGIAQLIPCPVALDVGTNIQTALRDDRCICGSHPRIGGKKSTMLSIDQIHRNAAKERWAGVLISSKILRKPNAHANTRAPSRFAVLVSNDDIQGTAAR